MTEATRAGRIEGTSRLAIQLTDLTLVDGQQLPIQSQFISRAALRRSAVMREQWRALLLSGQPSAAWPTGEEAPRSAQGQEQPPVLSACCSTRGHATLVYPESVLTFRIEAPVIVATDRAPEAFRYVEPSGLRPAERSSAACLRTDAADSCLRRLWLRTTTCRRITTTARAITLLLGTELSTSTAARAITALGITDIGKAIIADIAGNGGYLSDVANGLNQYRNRSTTCSLRFRKFTTA